MDDQPLPLPEAGRTLVFGTSGRPLIVVLHDEYGRLPGIEAFADALAAQLDARVAVPDLFDGRFTDDDDVARRLASELDPAAAAALVDEAIETAHAEGSPRVALLGFSMGGRIALRHAQTGSAEAVVAYYSGLVDAEHTLIPCPVLLHLAEGDPEPGAAETDAFVARLRDHGTPVAARAFAGARHGFANASLPARRDANAAALAFARSAVFLEQHLDG